MEAAIAIELDGQYRALREGAGTLERDRCVIQVAGTEAADYLQGQLTNDVEALSPGQGCYSALLDRKGRMQADMRVLRLDDGFLIDTERVAVEAVLRHLNMYKVGRDVTLTDLSNDHSVLSAIGPAALEIALGGPLVPEHAHRPAAIDGVACTAVATDTGLDLILSPADLAALMQTLRGAGAQPVSEAAAEIIRVESGRPRFGYEMTTATIPEEAQINERAVSFTKGCYIGQETVARLHYKGKPNRRLRGLRLSEPAGPEQPIRLGERELGRIGTAVISPAQGPIALAIVRREGQPGTMVIVGDAAEAELVELPF